MLGMLVRQVRIDGEGVQRKFQRFLMFIADIAAIVGKELPPIVGLDFF